VLLPTTARTVQDRESQKTAKGFIHEEEWEGHNSQLTLNRARKQKLCKARELGVWNRCGDAVTDHQKRSERVVPRKKEPRASEGASDETTFDTPKGSKGVLTICEPIILEGCRKVRQEQQDLHSEGEGRGSRVERQRVTNNARH